MDHIKKLGSLTEQVRETRLNRRHFSTGVAVGAATLAVSGSIARAQDATPVDGATPGASTPSASEVAITTVVSGLNAPRFIAIDGDTVYFTESGKGGDTAVFGTPAPGTPAAADPLSMSGYTGKLSAVGADGTVTPIVEDFLSYTFGANGEIVGAAGVGLDGAGKAYVSVGGPGPYVASIALTGEEDAVYEVDLATGEKKVVVDLGAYEIANNPDPSAIDSNLYGASFSDGTFYVADAGGNTVYSVNVATGEATPFAIPGGIEAPFLPESGNPLRGGAREIDSVPSDAVVGPDGNIYVSFVTGGPFPAGLSPIYAYAPDGTQSVFATGLTMVGSIAFSSDGTLYASIVSADFINQAPGMVVRVSADGNHQVVVDNLIVPAGIAFDAADNLFLAHKSTGFPDGGELVKITGVTTATGTPFVVPGAAAPSAPAATPVAAGVNAITLVLEDVKFDQDTLAIPANTDVTLTLENKGALPHDFTIDDPAISSGIIAGGDTTTLTLNLPAGSYTYYCSQPGHREAGMVGTLTVS